MLKEVALPGFEPGSQPARAGCSLPETVLGRRITLLNPVGSGLQIPQRLVPAALVRALQQLRPNPPNAILEHPRNLGILLLTPVEAGQPVVQMHPLWCRHNRLLQIQHGALQILCFKALPSHDFKDIEVPSAVSLGRIDPMQVVEPHSLAWQMAGTKSRMMNPAGHRVNNQMILNRSLWWRHRPSRGPGGLAGMPGEQPKAGYRAQ